MAKSLKDILSPENVDRIIREIKEKILPRAYWPIPPLQDSTVHHTENVDGDPHRLRTACGLFEWRSPQVHEVTCPKCLEAMAAAARVSVLSERPPCSPYCDHTRGEVVHEGGYGGPNGIVNKFKCGHCGRRYEHESGTGKWYELDANGGRVR